MKYASVLGINPGAGDQTTLINSSFANVNIDEIVMDVEGDYQISGGVIGQGKLLTFTNGTKLVGGGTLTDIIIRGPKRSHIFDESIGFVATHTSSSVRIDDDQFSAMWYGAIPDDNVDDTSLLQRAIDASIQIGAPIISFPAGSYEISKGLTVCRVINGNEFEQVTIELRGASKAYTANAPTTEIVCSHNDNFVFGIQQGKGVIIRNFMLTGLNNLQYTRAECWTASTTFIVNGCRSNSFSPYSGIVIDPFNLNVSAPNQYPGFSSFYIDNTNGGSTDFVVEDCYIRQFVCGIILSPNGHTANNEGHCFNRIWMTRVKDGFVTCNSQERTVVCREFKMWGIIQTCFRTAEYGANRGDVPIIDTLNVAGGSAGVFQILRLGGTGGYFPVIEVKGVHAEVFYRIGIVSGNTIKFTRCSFRLGYPPNEGLPIQERVINGSTDVYFDSCQLLYYSDVLGRTRRPVRFGSGQYTRGYVFENCYLHGFISGTQGNYGTRNRNMVEYRNSKFHSETGYVGNDIDTDQGANPSWGAGSNIQAMDENYTIRAFGERFGYETLHVERVVTTPIFQFPWIALGIPITIIDPEPPAKRYGQFTNATFVKYANVDDPVYMLDGGGSLTSSFGDTFDGGVIGIITNIDYVTGVVTFSDIVDGIPVGTNTYLLTTVYLQKYSRAWMGDINSSNPIVADRKLIKNVITPPNVGQRIQGYGIPRGAIVRARTETSTGSGIWTLELSVDCSKVANRVTFAGFGYFEKGMSTTNPKTTIAGDTDWGAISKGTFFVNRDTSSNILGWRCIKSGILDVTTPLDSFLPEFKAEYSTAEATDKFLLTANGNRPVVEGETLTEIYLRSTVNMTIDIGITPGGNEIVNDLALTANVTTIVNYQKIANTAFSVYFTGVAGGDLNISLLKEIVPIS